MSLDFTALSMPHKQWLSIFTPKYIPVCFSSTFSFFKQVFPQCIPVPLLIKNQQRESLPEVFIPSSLLSPFLCTSLDLQCVCNMMQILEAKTDIMFSFLLFLYYTKALLLFNVRNKKCVETTPWVDCSWPFVLEA